ncbi:MAG: alcohol dehydrogenase catalytic domain-containing protein [Paracoccaceae bacterium]|nr:alcohol dehydrogenase catalytic domain-containing protein [Paracoccaceae bacterium]MDE2913892.1 alcohol dehydrogenase catalytic domain-containing protein [Paracoccaceae bacterium]
MTDRIPAAFYRGNRTVSVEWTRPIPPGPDEVAIQVAYCGICGTDMHAFHGNMDSRVGFNRILGHEMSGTIASVGAKCTSFRPNQPVVVRPLESCGACKACEAGHLHICRNLKFLGLDTDGAFQSVWTVPAHTVHVLPDGLRLDHAALIEPMAVACHDVRLAGLRHGEDVVVIGGGPIGILVAFVARLAGGTVLVSEVNPHRIAVAERLGFDTVNPRTDGLESVVEERTGGKGADVVFEVSGTQSGVDCMTAVASARGRIVMVAIHASKPTVDLFQFFWRELRLIGARVYEREDYDRAIEIVGSSADIADILITDVHPLAKIQQAFEALDAEPSAMKSLIKVEPD